MNEYKSYYILIRIPIIDCVFPNFISHSCHIRLSSTTVVSFLGAGLTLLSREESLFLDGRDDFVWDQKSTAAYVVPSPSRTDSAVVDDVLDLTPSIFPANLPTPTLRSNRGCTSRLTC
jgi:hypothetical protein